LASGQDLCSWPTGTVYGSLSLLTRASPMWISNMGAVGAPAEGGSLDRTASAGRRDRCADGELGRPGRSRALAVPEQPVRADESAELLLPRQLGLWARGARARTPPPTQAKRVTTLWPTGERTNALCRTSWGTATSGTRLDTREPPRRASGRSVSSSESRRRFGCAGVVSGLITTRVLWANLGVACP
jgi:hypothetical protein